MCDVGGCVTIRPTCLVSWLDMKRLTLENCEPSISFRYAELVDILRRNADLSGLAHEPLNEAPNTIVWDNSEQIVTGCFRNVAYSYIDERRCVIEVRRHVI